ncbi:uncharacterized protein LOC106153597 isoform X2 [Lingula anatina]|uniref:ATP-dependent DNA helicase n=1 Tax=Lingula anatina TaxID=7574 RepID=A0A1S3HAL0_LINAN|nr:uncharacterized protein LOC106153597 isoform X2 [Lingula anatina]|eukprot:XP_013383043.1 uncharacterized protein LOC106153597 isoform X2 [Lingula anatina]
MPRKSKQGAKQSLAKKRESMRALRSSRYSIVSFVQGRIHQGSEIFLEGNAGSQCTCMALMALVYNEVKNVREWDSTDVESILYAGDDLYQRNRGEKTFLLVTELPTEVEYNESTYIIGTEEALNGSLGMQESCPPFYNLEDAVDLGYTQTGNFYFLMGSEELSYATMVLGQHDGRYYIFDSHSRNSRGLTDPNGKATVLELRSRSELVIYLRALASSLNLNDSTAFEVTPCKVRLTNDLFSFELKTYFEKQRKYEDMQKKEKRKEQVKAYKSQPITKTKSIKRDAQYRRKIAVMLKRKEQKRTYLSKPSVQEKMKESGQVYRSQAHIKEQRKVKDAIHFGQEEVKDARRKREHMFLASPENKLKKQLKQKSHRSKEEVRQKIRERDSKGRKVPEVKAARQTREKIYLADAEKRSRKQAKQKLHRSDREVKQYIQERDSKRRAQKDVKAARQTREKIYLADAEKRSRKQAKQKLHRSDREVKQYIQERDSKRRAQKDVKAATQRREEIYLADVETRSRKQAKQKLHRSDREVKQYIQERDSKRRAEKDVKEARQRREKKYLADVEKSLQKQTKQKLHRSDREVKQYIQERDSKRRAQKDVKAARQAREKIYLADAEKSSQKQAKQKLHRSKIEVKRKIQEREKRYLASKIVQAKRRIARKLYYSQKKIQTKIQERVKKHRAQEHIKEQRRESERRWRKSSPGIYSKRFKMEKLKEQQTNVHFAIQNFQKKCKEIPEFVCCCCNRLRFRNQVQAFREQNYQEEILILSKIIDMGAEKKICTYCHQKMSKKKVSPISYNGNSIKSMDMPGDIGTLNPIEQLLLTPVIPFMKIVSLPKSQQHGVHGPIVCVPANVKETITKLPASPRESGLIRVKLKRKLGYKGHHLYQKISPRTVKKAFDFLSKHHPDFSGIVYDEEGVKTTMEHLRNEDSDETVENSTTVGKSQGPLSKQQSNIQGNVGVEDDAETFNRKQPNLETSIDVGGSPETSSREESNMETRVTVGESQEISSREQSNDNTEDEVTETSVPLVTCLQPEDLAQHISDKYEDKILCFAPSENQHPESTFNKEVQSFPTLFPNGKNAFSESRKYKLSFSQYIKSRLFSADTKFAMNTQYIFYLQYIKEFQEVLSSAKISERKGSAKSGKINIDSFETENSLKQMLKNNEGYKFLSKVRGSAPYWERTMKDLCAMVKQLGIPTWFCSFSAADRRWKEIVHAILKSQGKVVPDEMDWTEHCKVINSNPVIAAAMFDKRSHHLINDLIKSASHPIGNVIDFFYRIEFQQRGWPHIHALFWVQDAPILDRSEPTDVVSFIDKYVTCQLPHEEEPLYEKVSKLQMHSKNHSRSCRKGNQTCRFNFPRQVSTRTFICKPIKLDEEQPKQIIRKEAREALEKLAKITSDEKNISLSAHQCLELAGMTQESLEYSMGVLARKTIIVLKREPKECWVNQYNPHLLEAWDANIDIQYIVDAYACICYIVSYISKKESEEGELLKAAQKEARQGNTEAVNELKTLGKVYITHREISVMEAIYRCTGMKLKCSSREVRWIAADKDATRLSLPLNILKQQAKEKRLDNIWAKSDLERYWHRPDNKTFEFMSLAHFVANYRMYGSKQIKTNKDNSDSENEHSDSEGKDITLLNNYGFISLRNRPIVIRYLKGSIDRDPERYFENRLRLFYPHRGQEILPSAFTSYESFHNNASFVLNDEEIPIYELVNRNSAPFEKDAEVIDSALQRSHDDHEDAWADIAPGAEEQRIDDKMEQNFPVLGEDAVEEVHLPDLDAALPDKIAYKKSNLSCEKLQLQISTKQAKEMLRSMNSQQLQIFNYMRKWCLKKSQGKNPKPFHIFLTGGAGTGKTHVINAFRYEAENILTSLDSPNENPDDIKVLLVAYTGTAAFNIQGQTIHSAFAIRSQKGKDRKKYVPLGEELLTELRVRYRSLQILVIDEISMVGQNMMLNISQRLNQIKQTNSAQSVFGDISVLAVGDFYQVAPVADKALYVTDPGQLYESEWNNFLKFELSIIMRQKDDQPFANLLNAIRTKKKEEQLKPHDKAMLLERVNDQLTADSTKLYIFPRNKEVDEHNKHLLETLCSDIITIEAADIIHSRSGQSKRKKVPFAKDSLALKPLIEIAVNARVMLTTNLNVSDGLSNGVMGTVVKIEQGTKPLNQPQYIWVHFDNPKIGANARQQTVRPENIPTNSVQLKPHVELFDHQSVKVARYQYPLKLAWACTVHKTQGKTVTDAVVSLKHVFAPGIGYVALSRATKLSGLQLLSFDKTDEANLYCDVKVDDAMKAMKPVNPDTLPILRPLQKTLTIVCHNIQSLPAHFKDLKSNPEMAVADIVGITESWLNSNVPSAKYSIPGFQLIRCDRQNDTSRGGVAVYIRNTLKATEVKNNFVTKPGFESVTLTINGYYVSFVYRSPSIVGPAFNRKIQEILSQNKKPIKPSILLGDFNIDLSKAPQTSVCLPCLQHHKQMIASPTFRGVKGYTSLLDHIYVQNVSTIETGTLCTYYSDHDPVYAVIPINA